MSCKPLYCMCGGLVIPQRYVLCFMTFMGVAVSYAMRTCLNIVIVEMVIQSNATKTTNSEMCPTVTNDLKEVEGEKYNWTQKQQGIIIAAFFPGYAIAHLPGGFIADVFGAKHIMSIGIAITALFTVITPFAVQIGDWWLFMITRIVIGVAQGPLYPCVSTLLAKWVPIQERTGLGSFVNSGNQLGSIAGFFVSSYLMEYKSWPMVFYVWGILGLVWYVIFFCTCFSEPSQHPFITPEEAQMLLQQIGVSKKLKVPWKAILLDSATWSLMGGQVAHDLIFFLVVSELATYMEKVLHFSITDNGLLNSIPYLCLWISSVGSGILADYVIYKQWASVTFLRQFYTTFGNVVPGVFVVAAAYMGCRRNAAAAMFILAMFVMGPFYAGMKVNVLDITKNFAGIIMGIVNGLGSMMFFPVPFVTAYMTPNNAPGEWRTVFWMVCACCIIFSIVYVVFVSTERAEWDKDEGET